MTHQPSRLPAWLPEALREDPKKAMFLAALLVVFAFVMFRTFFTSGPSAARAATPARVAKQKGDASLADNKVAPGSPSTAAARSWLKQPIMSVSRDLFAIHIDDFPLLPSKTTIEKGVVVKGFWDDIEKSRSQPADQKKRREMLVEDLQREAAKLRLQTTMMGTNPQAIIGGVVVREGAMIAASDDGAGIEFRIVKILSRRVVVEREGIRLELSMVE